MVSVTQVSGRVVGATVSTDALAHPEAPGVGSNGEPIGPEAIQEAILVSLVKDLLHMLVCCPPKVG